MNIRFYFDEELGMLHIFKHGITEDEVKDVMINPGEDRKGADDSRVAIGKTSSGKYLKVIYVPDPKPDSIFVITAYQLQGKPLSAYKKRRKKK